MEQGQGHDAVPKPTSETAGTQREDVEVLREAMTMALYISLSLLAVMLALPPSMMRDSATPALTVGLTAVGLIIAHQFAFRLSTRLVSQGQLDAFAGRLLGAQLAGGLAVVVVAVPPILVLGPDGVTWSVLLLFAFVAATGYLAARAASVGRLRAILYLGFVLVGAAAILYVKSLVGH